jgi:hypothetical protein
MPEYEFEDVETGEAVDLFFHMREAPEIGSVVTVAGQRLRRVPSREKIQAHVERTEFKCYSQPPWTPGADHYDEMGHPCFDKKRDAIEFGKKNGLTYGEI